MPHAPTTIERRLGAAWVLRRGARGSYRGVAYLGGEPRLRRDELGTSGRRGPGSRSLGMLVQMTDLQLADVMSPGRFEFFETLRGTPGAGAFVPAQRAQEAFAFHAMESMTRTLAELGPSPETGEELSLAVFTGDSIDNAQLNELEEFVRLAGGGTVAPLCGAERYDGVQASAAPAAPGSPSGPACYWHPGRGHDLYKELYGYPEAPGALEEVAHRFEAHGVPVPWLSCFGNHEGLVLGEALPTAAYQAIVIGDRKAVALRPGIVTIGAEEELFSHPERWLAGPSRTVPADPRRRAGRRRDFVRAHLGAPGLPAGHGFTTGNLDDATAYGVYDWSEEVRVVLLDTANLDGDHSGSIGERQMAWLGERLAEVHSTYGAEDGAEVRTGERDRLVVLVSHHGPASLTNLRHDEAGYETDQPRHAADEIASLVHRFPNVVLWLSGHRHVHDITLRRGKEAASTSSGFWDVATAAMADWPCQARAVELVANADGTLSILCTVIDHGAPPDPRTAAGSPVDWLGSLHRQLAANVPSVGFGSRLEGQPEDRNVELLLPFPFART